MPFVAIGPALEVLLVDQQIGTGLEVHHKHLDVRTGFVID